MPKNPTELVFNCVICGTGLPADIEQQIQAQQEEIEKFAELMRKYRCNPTGQLSTFEAIRDLLETSHRLCNDNYDWAKKVEAERDALQATLEQDRELYRRELKGLRCRKI
ncbi:MAG TPA: hypothetical protein VFE27_24425 [Acidobacteriaceae bacterium]|jgi:hypothetical protein|nr:hypothetical protein [Acidobacteriaceae bacterium]